LPSKLSQWADLIGLYRLAECEQVTHQALTQPHRQRTLELMRACESVVLLIHDSSELDYTHITELHDELGQIGNGGGRGYIAHHSLAVTPDGQVLGLASQILHRRRKVAKTETPQQKRRHPDRESRLWLRGCEAIGAAPTDRLWVDVCDRGSDTFEFLEYEQLRGRKYVIRSARNRNLDGADHIGSDRIHQTLHGYARDLPELGVRQIEVPPRPGKKGKRRPATVAVSAGRVTIQLPHFARGECQLPALDLWVIHVKEINPPSGAGAGAGALEWILLSNLPADTFAAACEKIDWYARRPIVEDYHKGLKSGVGIELLQLERIDRLEPVIGLLSVIAVLLLQLRHQARAPDAQAIPARNIVPLLWVQVLSGHLHKQVRSDLTVSEFLRGVARLGGHLGRKNDGPPGWLTLWRGWSDLHRMIEGAEAMRWKRCV
jgi:hypothetical protein